MYGWINASIEALVLEKFGADIWNQIKIEANVQTPTEGWIRHSYYDDALTYALAIAVSKVLNLSLETVLEVYGDYFLTYVSKAGFEELLKMQGNTLFEFLGNINNLHRHLQHNLPELKAPSFICEIDTQSFQTVDKNILAKDDTTTTSQNTDSTDSQSQQNQTSEQLALLFHYESSRVGLAPLVLGVTKAVAREYFGLTINMTSTSTSEVNGKHLATWRLTLEKGDPLLFGAIQALELYRANAQAALPTSPLSDTELEISESPLESSGIATNDIIVETSTSVEASSTVSPASEDVAPVLRCPFSGVALPASMNPHVARPDTSSQQADTAASKSVSSISDSAPSSSPTSSAAPSTSPLHHNASRGSVSNQPSAQKMVRIALGEFDPKNPLTQAEFQSLFPFHILFDSDLKLVSAGSAVTRLFDKYQLSCGTPGVAPASTSLTSPQGTSSISFFSDSSASLSTSSSPNATNATNIESSLSAGTNMQSAFLLNMPSIPWTWDRIVANQHASFEMTVQNLNADSTSNRSTVVNVTGETPLGSKSIVREPLRLKGGIKILAGGRCALFMASPNVRNMEDLNGMGLKLNDIPIHDPTRDMLLLGAHLSAEINASLELDKKNKALAEGRFVKVKQAANQDILRSLTIAAMLQLFWLALELVDLITDYTALVSTLENDTLSQYHTVYIIFVVIATILSLFVLYDRAKILYKTLKQRFSGTVNVSVLDALLQTDLKDVRIKDEMRLIELQGKTRHLGWGIGMAICEDIPQLVLNLLILSKGMSWPILVSLLVNCGALGFKLRGIDNLGTGLKDIALLQVKMAEDEAKRAGLDAEFNEAEMELQSLSPRIPLDMYDLDPKSSPSSSAPARLNSRHGSVFLKQHSALMEDAPSHV